MAAAGTVYDQGTATFAEGLRRASGGRPLRKPAAELPDEALVDVPPTADVLEKLYGVRDRLAKATEAAAAAKAAPPAADQLAGEPDSAAAAAGLPARLRNELVARQRVLERLLEEAQERDRRVVAQGRPAGCWCLGLGGKGERRIMLGSAIDPEAQQWHATVDAVLDVTVFEDYCPCPDGAQMSSEHLGMVQAAVARIGQQRAERQLREHWADVGLPENSERYPTLDDFPVGDARQANTIAQVKTWRPPRWLCLVGRTRVGKTTIAAALARHADRLGYSVRFRTMDQILERLKAAMDHEGEAVDDVLQALLDVDVLVIDDLGAESATRWAIGRILAMLDQRLTKERTTIITSNLDLGRGESSLVAHLVAASGGDPDFRIQAGRIVARIKEQSDVVLVDGPSLQPDRPEALPW